MRYDLIVLGHDHHGRHAALAAAQHGKRVALIESRDDELPTTSSLREAASRLLGVRPHEPAKELCVQDRRETMRQLRHLSKEVIQEEAIAFERCLNQYGGELIDGQPWFVGPHDIEVNTHANGTQWLTGDHIVLAVGTQPIRPKWVPFDGQVIFDRNELLALPRLPKSMIVIGADITALQSAMLFGRLGTRVVFVDSSPKLMPSWDRQLVRRFRVQAQRCGVRFRLGRSVLAIDKTFDERAAVRLDGGKSLLAECVLYVGGCRGNTGLLNLSAAGLLPDEQGRIWCNEQGQTWVKHIYAIGDVVGFPILAHASLDQSPRFVESLWGNGVSPSSPTAYGLRTTPQLAMVGATEEQLRDDLVAYEVGISRFVDVPHGQFTGKPTSMLKLLFHRESLELLGVHCLSDAATELIRLGETVMSLGGTIESFVGNSFEEAPLTECYRQAAENGLARLTEEVLSAPRRPNWDRRKNKASASRRERALTSFSR
jgi:NAD(P) transhydrogenase